MTYEQCIDYLFMQLPMFSRIGAAAYKADLHNTVQLCNVLGNPQNNFQSIHVAGTNGKGSVSNMLAAILQEAGYKTGLYTSPHLKDFRERIRINGEMIDKEFVVEFVEQTKATAKSIQPSFFELTVAMAFQYFKQEKVDIAVIETGLGGRLDSTNVIRPMLSVITNIGLDHMQLLGNTLPEIAREKAGIIKTETPVIVGETSPETLPVFIEKANTEKAPLFIAANEFRVDFIDPSGELLLCNLRNMESGIVEKLRVGLPGIYQAKNLCTVLSAVSQLRKAGFKIPEYALHRGIENVQLITGIRGRWEAVSSKPSVILDVAHNEDGIRSVLEHLSIVYPHAQPHFIIGFVNDKDINGMLRLLPAAGKYFFTNAHIPRALLKDDLKEMANQHNLHGDAYDDVNEAIMSAIDVASLQDVIIVCGSFFVVAEVDETQVRDFASRKPKP